MVLAIKQGAYGFSSSLGKWSAAPFDANTRAAIAGGARLIPIVSENIGAIAIGNHIYAYSPMTGTWDQLQVDIDAGINALSTMKDMAIVNYGDHLAIFSVYTGKWKSVVWDK
jgi:hypothetical protein